MTLFLIVIIIIIVEYGDENTEKRKIDSDTKLDLAHTKM